MRFVTACFIFLGCFLLFAHLFIFLSCLVLPMFICRRFTHQLVAPCVYFGGNYTRSPLFRKCPSVYVGAWAPWVENQALAEGGIPFLRCFMPQRVGPFEVRFHSSYTFSLSLQISRDQG